MKSKKEVIDGWFMDTPFSTYLLARFTLEQVKKSGLNQYQLAEKLGKSQSAINHALNPKKFSETRRNGARVEILDLLGFAVEKVFIVKKTK